jgi:isopropylmalate/homocitrate/citramalate synthase
LIIGYNGTTTAIGFDANTSIQGLVDAVNNDAKLKGKIEMSFDGTTGKLNIRAVDASVQTVQFGIREDTNAETTSHADFGFGMAASLVANQRGCRRRNSRERRVDPARIRRSGVGHLRERVQ